MQNFMANLKPGGGGDGSGGVDDGIPWWMKYAGKGLGLGSGIAAIMFGVMACFTITPLCIVAGIWQVLAGVLVISIEAPFCCMFLDFVQQFSSMMENRPIWQKAGVYLILALPPLLLCFSFSTGIGSGLIFGTAVLYGMQVLGKKSPQADMAAMAQAQDGQMGDQSAMMDADQQYGQAPREEMAAASGSATTVKPETMKTGLVGNIHGQDVEAAKPVGPS